MKIMKTLIKQTYWWRAYIKVGHENRVTRNTLLFYEKISQQSVRQRCYSNSMYCLTNIIPKKTVPTVLRTCLVNSLLKQFYTVLCEVVWFHCNNCKTPKFSLSDFKSCSTHSTYSQCWNTSQENWVCKLHVRTHGRHLKQWFLKWG